MHAERTSTVRKAEIELEGFLSSSSASHHMCVICYMWVFSFSGKATGPMRQSQCFWASCSSSYLPGDPSLPHPPPAIETQVRTMSLHNKLCDVGFNILRDIKWVTEVVQHCKSTSVTIHVLAVRGQTSHCGCYSLPSFI